MGEAPRREGEEQRVDERLIMPESRYGKAPAVLAALRGRGMDVSEARAARARSERDEAILDGWLARAGRRESVAPLLAAAPGASRG